MPKKNILIKKKKNCYFCTNQRTVDHKDSQILRRFLSSYAKIKPRRKTGVCAKHQRKLAIAVKRARIMALLPFVKR